MANKLNMLVLCLIFSSDYGCTNSEKENIDAGEPNDAGADTATELDSDARIEGFTCEDSENENCITQMDKLARTASLAMNSDGFGVIAYTTEDEIMLAKCQNIACSEIVKNKVDGKYDRWSDCDGECGYEPPGMGSIAIGSDNLPIIAYYYSYSTSERIAHCKDITCSSYDISELGAFRYSWITSQKIIIGSDGLPIYTASGPYLDYYNIEIRHCSDKLCGDDHYGGYEIKEDTYLYSITIGADGLGLVTYVTITSTSVELKTFHCNNVECSDGNIVTVDSWTNSEPGSFGNTIATGSDGLGVISYIRGKYLSIAHCKDIGCSKVDINEIDAQPLVAPAITVGSDDLPIIAFLEENSGIMALKVAHCEDLLCKTAEINIVDSDYCCGSLPSIAIGSDGLPLIVYTGGYSVPSEGLKPIRVLHCSNVTCAP